VAQHPALFYSVFTVSAFFPRAGRSSRSYRQGALPCSFGLVVSCPHHPESGFNRCAGPSCLPRSLRSVSLSVCLDFQFLVPASQGDGGPAVHESSTLLLGVCSSVSFFCKVLVCESLQRDPGIALESPD
jgi:hypothetical protein